MLLIMLQVISFWPAWYWYIMRLADGSDDSWGVIALLTILILCLLRGQRIDCALHDNYMLVAVILIAFYAVFYHSLSPMTRTLIALSTIAYTLSIRYLRIFRHPALWGLLILALPVFSSLTFYFSYPLRRIAGLISISLIRIIGIPVSLDGTMLRWQSNLIWIDAPCSGIRMLWTTFYLFFTLSVLMNLRFKTTFLLAPVSLFIAIFGNALRSSSLFLLEIKRVSVPSWMHTGVGVLSFIFSSLILVVILQQCKKKENAIL